ncbi:MAG: tetratricopeptide repeat protein, partial [Anaerolineales bacterium]
MNLSVYIPQDRLRSIVQGEPINDRNNGSALFADISGFSSLTEALSITLGPRQGAEEITKHLDNVYGALITDVENYGGIVIDFAGDAIICWFDAENEIKGKKEGSTEPSQPPSAAIRAVNCAFTMQKTMRSFKSINLPNDKKIEIALKVSIATGNSRRFLVGDPNIRYLDTLAGTVITRTSTAELLANKGEVLIDEETLQKLEGSVKVTEWRSDQKSGERYALVTPPSKYNGMVSSIDALPVIDVNNQSLIDDLKPFIEKSVFEREISGQGSFLTEFRPCAVLFVRFTGINYEEDAAGSQLDKFIRMAQRTTSRYGGNLLTITIGDKGSYVSIVIGALNAYEDDARRSVKIALEMQTESARIEFLKPLQIGLTYGTVRIGTFGGSTRKTYGIMGEYVNIAARLMQLAKPEEILTIGVLQKSVSKQFVFEPRPAMSLKGKSDPLPVFALTGERTQRAVRLQEPNYVLPMVGRVKELKEIDKCLDLVVKGKSQIVAIVGEAGIGKSRLIAEAIRSAHRKGFIGYGGSCQSESINSPYHAWKNIWKAFFEIDPDHTLKKQMRNLEGEIEDRAPNRLEAIPLLNVVLDLTIPENDFTRLLEPQIRQSALHALLEECLKAATQDTPLLIVIEDMHWIDALSHDLLERLAKSLANTAICFLIAYRPPQLERLQEKRLEVLPQFTKIELHTLNKVDTEIAVHAKIAQLYPTRRDKLPDGLVETLNARAQGNPFYLEELINFIRDRGLDPEDLNNIELPNSLHTLILSRIDQLNENQKICLRVASIIGRKFLAYWLTGYYPELGPFAKIRDDLNKLQKTDILSLDSPDPELTYLFNHIVIHEVTYQSLPFALRAELHEKLAKYLEESYPDALPLEMLAFHYERSNNLAKKIEYFRKAGESAQKNFANETALDFYGKLLQLSGANRNNSKEQTEIYLKRGQVYELLGMWAEAEGDYRAALNLSSDNKANKANSHFALGKLNRLKGDYDHALNWLSQSREVYLELNDLPGLAQVLIETGAVLWHKGEYDLSRLKLNEGLAMAKEIEDISSSSLALNNLGVVAFYKGDYSEALLLHEESLKLRREIGDKWGISTSLHSLGSVALAQGNYEMAKEISEESLLLRRETGDRFGISASLGTLGTIAWHQGDYPKARALYEECATLVRDMGDKWGMAIWLTNLGNIALELGDIKTARQYFNEFLTFGNEDDQKNNMAYVLLGLGLADLAENEPSAKQHILESLRLREETGEQLQQTSSIVGLAALELHNGNASRAAQLLGVVASALKDIHAKLEVEVKHLYDKTLNG